MSIKTAPYLSRPSRYSIAPAATRGETYFHMFRAAHVPHYVPQRHNIKIPHYIWQWVVRQVIPWGGLGLKCKWFKLFHLYGYITWAAGHPHCLVHRLWKDYKCMHVVSHSAAKLKNLKVLDWSRVICHSCTFLQDAGCGMIILHQYQTGCVCKRKITIDSASSEATLFLVYKCHIPFT